jgi:hypothetical protein
VTPPRTKSDRSARMLIEIPLGLGIDESQEASALQPGVLLSCKNWVPEPSGGLRAREGWILGPNARDAAEGDTFPTTKKIRGLFYCSDYIAALSASRSWYLAALLNDSSTPEVWVLKSDLSGGWFRLGFAVGGTDLVNYPMAFGKGGGDMLITNPGLPEMKSWDLNENNNLSGVPSMSDPGQALAFHKSRMYSGGSLAKPYRLYYSSLTSVSSWTVGSDFLNVGSDDGEPITDLVEFGNQLIIAKRNGVWIFIGDPASNYSLVKLDGARGMRGRCIVPTPRGAVFLGEEEVSLWEGGVPKPISRPIETTYVAGSSGWRTGVYAGGSVYIASSVAAQPLLVFDLERGVWHTEPTDDDNHQMISIWSKGNRLVGGPRASTIAAPLNYRDIRTGARAKDFSTLAETFSMRTPDLWITQARQRMVLRHAYVRLRQRSGGVVDNDVKLKPYVDGVALGAGQDIPSRGGSNPQVFHKKLDYGGKEGRSIGFELSTTVPGAGGAVYDIEGPVLLEVDREPAG